MESHAKYALVGTAVIVFAVLIVGALLWISKAANRNSGDYYMIYFRKHTLDGLQVDSYVTMKGIVVGNVTDIEISPRDIAEVRVLARVEEGTPVKTDTQAVIRRNLLTGLARVDLINSTQEAFPLDTVPEGERYPVIPEGESEITQIASTIPQLVEEASQFVQRANNLLSEENREAFSNTIANWEKVSRALADRDKEITETIVNVQSAAKEMAELSKSLEDLARNLSRNSSEIRVSAVETLRSADSAIKNMDERTKEMAGTLTVSSRVVAQDLHNLSQSIGEAARSLSVTAERFDNPQAIIAGPAKESLGPGEGIK